MQESQFTELIMEIPPQKWEESLPIGKFLKLDILHRFTRPFSFIARCRVEGDRDSRVVYIKRYRNLKNRPPEVYRQKVEKEHQTELYWYQKFADSENFRVVKPVFVIPEEYLSVTEESRGKNLFHLILKDARYFPPRQKLDQLRRYLRNTGAWLRYKQSILSDEKERYSISGLMEYMEVRLKILSEDKRRRFPAAYPEKVRAFVEQHQSQISAAERQVTTSHSDFNPGNILVEGNTVTVLDFGRLVKESYLLDVSKLYFQLNLLKFKPQYRTKTIRQLQQALLEGFGDPGAGRLLMFRLLTIRNILTHLSGITQFWKQGFAEKIYNTWVMRRELALLDGLLKGKQLE